MLKEFVQRLARLLPTRRAMMEAEVSASASEVVEKKVGDDVHKNHEEIKMHHVKDGRIEKPKTDEDPERKRVKTFRYAMLVGYQGKNYFGMQVQKKFTAPTIEGHILDALLKNKWITQAQFDRPFDFFFQRAARTDKAVSAVRQICSMQLPRMDDLSVDGAAKMNDHLPADIRVFGFRRTTKSFHSQKDCDARTYSYTLPTFAFAKPHEKTDASFRITPETRAEIDEVLDIYKGTHNFFNYTSRKEFDDRSCFRYIMEFKCGEPFLFKDEVRGGDVEFITVTVKGQSFILHQIRKMMGMTISVVRELQNKSAIQRSFESKRMDVPKAPGLGLLLERLHFHNYDKRFGSQSHEPLSNWGEMIEQQVEEMKMKYITKEIMDTEIREQSMMRWLADLILHGFSVDPEAEEVEKGAFVCMAAAKAKEALEAAKAEAAPVNGDAKTEESAPESSEECNEKKVAPVEVAST